jgi:hypothetical protein
MFQNESDRLAEIRQALFTRLALTVGPRHLSTVRDVPWAITLDNRRELVAHDPILRTLQTGAPAHLVASTRPGIVTRLWVWPNGFDTRGR